LDRIEEHIFTNGIIGAGWFNVRMAVFPVGADPRGDPTRTKRGEIFPRGESGAGPQNQSGWAGDDICPVVHPRGPEITDAKLLAQKNITAQWPNSPWMYIQRTRASLGTIHLEGSINVCLT